MKQLFLLLLFVCSGNLLAQRTITDTITSQKLNEDREIKIGLPPSYDKNKAQKYPLLILFDGDFLFDAFQGALSYGYYWDDLPEVIVVAISQNKNNERETDCTFDETTGLPSEKGADFFEFVGMELIPSIQKNFRVAPFRMVAGLDTTAAFLNCYLYKDQPIFNAYISMSPELPEGMEEQIPERLAAMQQTTFYYHCTAEGDMKKMKTRIQALDAAVKNVKNPKLNYLYEEFKGASHYSLVLHAIPSALYQIFSVYQPISTVEFQEKIAVLPSGYVKYLVDKYAVLENSLGLKLQIRINDFKAIEAAILKNKAYVEFDELSQLARKNYPKSMLADYHLGQMYEKTGDTKRAIKSYQTAFQKDEIGDLTKDMMLERADALKGELKNKKEEVIEETPPTEEVPTDTPPSETPAEEKKPE
ncbi:alpha/beta hydrolase-fold protein [Flavobacterium sp.]|uniref:alpha/beta hydrolase-fold protein n=1 Tax=Flavobacterium sp. TaxID=239 RepID=UPI00391BD163